MLPELPTFAQFFLKDEEKLALEEESEGTWDEERIALFFLFFPELKLVLLLLLLAPLRELGEMGVEGPEEMSLGLNDDDDLVVLLLEEEERDLSARPEAREGADEEEDEWAEGI